MEFERERLLIGEKVDLLNKKTVLVLGLGGVGGYVVEALARASVGHLILVDYDIVDITNINRQNNMAIRSIIISTNVTSSFLTLYLFNQL